MAKLSSRAADALDRVLKRRNLPDLRMLISSLEHDVENDVQLTARIEQCADMMLGDPRIQHGQRLAPGYNMEYQLVAGLDGADIARALGIAKSVENLVVDERAAWVLEEEKKHKPIHGGIAIKFEEDPKHGPGTSSWLLTH